MLKLFAYLYLMVVIGYAIVILLIGVLFIATAHEVTIMLLLLVAYLLLVLLKRLSN